MSKWSFVRNEFVPVQNLRNSENFKLMRSCHDDNEGAEDGNGNGHDGLVIRNNSVRRQWKANRSKSFGETLSTSSVKNSITKFLKCLDNIPEMEDSTVDSQTISAACRSRSFNVKKSKIQLKNRSVYWESKRPANSNG